MFGPWFSVTLLALESSEVIGLSVAKLADGGVDAQHEAHLMVSERLTRSLRLVRGYCAARLLSTRSIDFGNRSRPMKSAFQLNVWLHPAK